MLSRLSLDESGSLIDEAAVNALTGTGRTDRVRCERLAGDGLRRDTLKDNLHELQRAQVLAALAEAGNNVSKTARRLGVSRNMIYRTLRDRN